MATYTIIMNLRLCKMFATLGPLGYLAMPGTMGTLATLPLVYATHQYICDPYAYVLFLCVSSAVSIFIISYALVLFRGHSDPHEIILDEVVGCLITFWQVALTWQSIIAGFLLFRFFDIVKFGFVKNAEKLPGAWGVVVDDVVAGILANIFLRLLFNL